MATPTIAINNGGTGSDTAASGAGPSTAIFGTNASFASTVVTLDGSPDLSGVDTTGLHVLWLKTSTGRQYSVITAKANSGTPSASVTVADAPAGTSTGRTWAIGGKRATLDHADTRPLFATDNKTGWVIDIAETGTTYTLTSTLSIASIGLQILSSSASRPLINTATNTTRLFTYTNACTGLLLSHLSLSNTATTRAAGLFPSGAVGSAHQVTDCVFDGFSIAVDGSNGAGQYFNSLTLDACWFKNGVNHLINNPSNGNGPVLGIDCFFSDASGTSFSTVSSFIGRGCIWTRNDRAIVGGTFHLGLLGCIVHGQTSTTQPAVSSGAASASVNLQGNIFYGNANTFAAVLAGQTGLVNRLNAYGSNVANRSGFSAGTGDVTLTANPFTNAASNDFTLNATAGGGAALKALWNNVRAPGLVGTAYGDLGPFQSQAAASGGLLLNSGMQGGLRG